MESYTVYKSSVISHKLLHSMAMYAVFDYLDIRTLFSLQLVCKRFYERLVPSYISGEIKIWTLERIYFLMTKPSHQQLYSFSNEDSSQWDLVKNIDFASLCIEEFKPNIEWPVVNCWSHLL